MAGSRWRSLVVVVTILSAGCSAEQQPDQAAAAVIAKDSAPTPTEATLLFIGTSLTAGKGLPPDQRWTSLIQDRIESSGWNFKVVNAGVSGETSAATLGRLAWVVENSQPAVVVVETGANDGLRGLSIDSLAINLDSILTRLGRIRPEPVVFVAGMEALPNMGADYVDRFRKVFPEAARRHGDHYLPFLLEGVAGRASLNQGDGIHPNQAGSVLVAGNVWRALRPVLDSLASAATPR